MTNKLYIFCGIPFSGKTTLSKEVVEIKKYKRIDLDEIKFALSGQKIKDSEIDQSGWDRIYQEMYKQIEEQLSRGETVTQDAGNFTKYERDLVRNIAQKIGIEAVTVFIDTPYNVAKERLLANRNETKRFDVPDEDFESTVKEMEPPDEKEKHITYKSGTPVEDWIKHHF